jgi:ABC-type amino acid transport substrate-binding protein
MGVRKKQKSICTLLLFISILAFFHTKVFSKNTDKILFISTLHQIDEVKDIYEMVSQAYNNIGYQVRILKMPAKRSLIEVRKAQGIDGELARVRAAEKLLPDHIRIPVAVKTVPSYLYSYKKSYNVENWRDLKPYRIAIIRGIISHTLELESNLIDSIEVTTARQAFDLLKRDRVDIVIIPEPLVENIIHHSEFRNIVRSTYPIEKKELFHFIHKKYKDIVPKITESLLNVSKAN